MLSYISEMKDQEKPTDTKALPEMPTMGEIHHQEYSLDGLEEHVVVDTFVMPLLDGLPDNVIEILYYSSTEMINNAIDHSEGRKVEVFLISEPDKVKIWITDDGIGIFNKVKKELQLNDPRDTILELCKGKFTTDPKHHTGEGIFFTSRVCDKFFMLSDTLQFGRISDTDWLVEEQSKLQKGTLVAMEISTNCPRKLKEVFDKFTSDESGNEEFGFTRTHVPISIAEYGPDGLISRSKAKRVVSRFGKFKEVVLDFKGVECIGQAFADEIFRVFAKAHPDVNISAVNANENVRKMILRAKTSNIDSEED